MRTHINRHGVFGAASAAASDANVFVRLSAMAEHTSHPSAVSVSHTTQLWIIYIVVAWRWRDSPTQTSGKKTHQNTIQIYDDSDTSRGTQTPICRPGDESVIAIFNIQITRNKGLRMLPRLLHNSIAMVKSHGRNAVRQTFSSHHTWCMSLLGTTKPLSDSICASV